MTVCGCVGVWHLVVPAPQMKLAWLRWLWLFLAVVKVHADEFAFFDAVSAGDTSAVSESLAAGVDPNYADEDGLTPLILAAKHGRLEVMLVTREDEKSQMIT